MRIGTLLWGLAFLAAGAVVLAGLALGASDWSTGPRIGIGMVLLLLGFLLAAGPWIAYAVRRASSKESKGGCPVGTTCACGHFNFKPRAHCRECGTATTYPE
ncbi:MAG: hypothetical protein V4510_07895 [bacterium]